MWSIESMNQTKVRTMKNIEARCRHPSTRSFDYLYFGRLRNGAVVSGYARHTEHLIRVVRSEDIYTSAIGRRGCPQISLGLS